MYENCIYQIPPHLAFARPRQDTKLDQRENKNLTEQRNTRKYNLHTFK